MSDRVAQIVVLAEDQEHQILVRRYLLLCGHERRSFLFLPLPGGRGCGSQFVRENFPKQVAECRRRLGRGASCMLIVITDADKLDVAAREHTLQRELSALGHAAMEESEPIIVLIPKWQVETWIKCLLGRHVDEMDPTTDRPAVTREQIISATVALYDWTRPGAAVGATCAASLKTALPRWKRIG